MSVDAGFGAESGEESDGSANATGQPQLSLSTAAARNLATTTKTAPQMQGITSRWLLRILPWVQVSGGTYRVNRRLTYTVGNGRVEFVQTGSEVRVIPDELGELPVLRDFHDPAVLAALAERFEQREFAPGQPLTELGRPVDQVFLVAHGRINKVGTGKFGEPAVLGVLADGDHFGDEGLTEHERVWEFTATAATHTTVLMLPRESFRELLERAEGLREHVASFTGGRRQAQNRHGEAEIRLAAGHHGEAELPGTFVDYEASPREYELSVAQTVLRVHTRVADLYNQPMNQVEHQLKLTIEALRERQEHELVNNREFGLLHNAEFSQRIRTHSGPPTPDDLDELISRRRNSQYLLAHPRAIAAFGRECNKRGLYPGSVDFHGNAVPSWRGIPLLPCNKIPINEDNTSSIFVLRVGEDNQGVVGLHQTGLPDEYEPSLSVRFMGINEKAVISYLVSAYYSAAVLVPDALGVLEDVEIGRRD
ncbi:MULTISPECIES: family 2B encapsulin nanocompartment shell protein [Streptomycetaceae]|uniref:Putative transcriptional regulator, Crp/Fnr family n=1 Tax=Streptantibioticus cattleyicolor (strain ATCC 35852 / DSM 46488 / JCM 4925 / NBRC 14057 / NRRL 8057) TaxID=1003195 RepID=F8JRT8_STREN|nr:MULTISPECIES: family 2B encapsulin nanocompartment shell protein [Streptomycetaceae]AEW97475.1 putative transcriptional regulator, Crp/Fnr family [Streptantibioticus cattleyicolor NRRL 8057 = DSM 46488]MYS61910.1 cyclic nucleotide-binding domain-containing protein [Streptomyces sp. SID5468]CCB77796.1 Cyclic nucleotide-binding protein [Streptantibioticus cattleyicolor NRRL 8057 = DSM 46488]